MNLIKKISQVLNKKNGFFTFIRAQFSSQISSQFDFLVTILCANLFGVFYGNATLIGNIMGGILNCFINYKWTFKAKDVKVKHVLIKFIIVWLISLLLNRQGTIFFTEFVLAWVPVAHLPAIITDNIFLLPKIVVSIIVGIAWNYNMQRVFVYKNISFRKHHEKIDIKPVAAKTKSLSKINHLN